MRFAPDRGRSQRRLRESGDGSRLPGHDSQHVLTAIRRAGPLAEGKGPPSEPELFELAWAAARGGSVSALRLVREMLRDQRRDGDGDELTFLDEVAARREARRETA